MKAKVVCLLVVLLFFKETQIYCQHGGSNDENYLTLSGIVPTSPSTYQFTKYGEVPINEATGAINENIQLFTYNAGEISIPISMNYYGNGVKVDQQSTNTGINWSLNAGGVITCQMRDLPDIDNSSSRVQYTVAEFESMNGSNTYEFNSLYCNNLDQLNDNNIDSEADIFNYNFNGYSGSFVLDKNLIPSLVKYDKEVKIEINAAPTINGVPQQHVRTIIITIENGTKYYFGGTEASENQRYAGINQFETSNFYQSAFYLYKIQNYLGDEVYFQYTSRSDTYKLGEEHKLIYGYKCISSETPEFFSGINKEPNFLMCNNKTLSNISSNKPINGEVIFNYQDIQITESDIFKDVLQSILLKNNFNQGVHLVKFEYLYPNQNKRFFLNSIYFENQNGDKSNVYNFSYNDPGGLPPLYSYSQDYEGYYNGKNNMVLIPEGLGSFFDNTYHLADRKPYLFYSLKGSLAQIKYPTGGYSNFEYELAYNRQIPWPPENHIINVSYNSPYGGNNPSNPINLPNNIICFSNYLTPDEGDGDLVVTTDNFNFDVNFTINTHGYFNQHNYVSFEIYKGDENGHQLFGNPYIMQIENTGLISIDANLTFQRTFNLPIGNYYFKYSIYLDAFNGYNVNNSVIARANLLLPDVNTTIPEFYPGLRIKRIVSYSGENELPEIKRFYYNEKDKINIENVYVVHAPQYDSHFYVENSCMGVVVTALVHQRSSNSLTSVFVDSSHKILYPIVTVSYGGDNFEKGGKESHYKVLFDNEVATYKHGNYFSHENHGIISNNTSNISWDNGTLLSEELFKKDLNGFITLRDTKYFYKTDVTKSKTITNNLIIKPVLSSSAYNPCRDAGIGIYETYSIWKSLDSISITEYFNGNIHIAKKYKYDTKLAGLPTQEIYYNSNSEKKITEFNYQINQDDNTSLFFINNHILTAPHFVKEYNENNLLKSKLFNYFDWGTNFSNTNSIVKPSNINTFKGNHSTEMELENKITYFKYNSNGKQIELSKNNGPHIYYIWGYQGTNPIAIIENFSESQALSIQTLIDEAVNASNIDDDRTQIFDLGHEGSLRNKLKTIQNNLSLINSKMTFYTYDPLVGLTSITDPKGDTQYYSYDSFNRLQYVKDKDGKVLSENEYHYRP